MAFLERLPSRTWLEPLLRPVLHFYWRLSRGMTLGVRAMVIDGEGRVLLIKHSYVAGWHLPGGGVEVGETMRDALDRELLEEANVAVVGEPVLHGMFFNGRISNRDHVAVYAIREFRQDSPPVPDHEIVAHGFFHPRELPDGTTRGTRERIAEVLAGAPVSATW